MSEERIPVRGHSDLVRDPHSQALINTNKSAYNAAIVRRNAALKQNMEMNQLKNEVDELKGLVKQVLNKLEDNNG